MIEYNYPRNDVNRFSVNDIINFIFDYINKKLPRNWSVFCAYVTLYNGEVEYIDSTFEDIDVPDSLKCLIEMYIMALMHFSFEDLSFKAMNFPEEGGLRNSIDVQIIIKSNRSGKLGFLGPAGLDCPFGSLDLLS